MKKCVYILLCRNARFYVGSAKNLEDRLSQHHSGRVFSTRNLRPFTLTFSQSFASIQEARRTEYWLKKQKDKDLLLKIISDGTIRMVSGPV
ncbi:GIY-YIG nuclease family protein [Candidatus Peregrinibacteria bacterium]|nr:GIY-YIG nuclease family protein [Candidatus Peregrinibacteria bacterium]